MSMPFKNAMDAFKDSDEWLTSSDPLTLKSTAANRVYLENRLHLAFAAGWNAAMLERRFGPDGRAEHD